MGTPAPPGWRTVLVTLSGTWAVVLVAHLALQVPGTSPEGATDIVFYAGGAIVGLCTGLAAKSAVQHVARARWSRDPVEDPGGDRGVPLDPRVTLDGLADALVTRLRSTTRPRAPAPPNPPGS